MSQKTKRKTTPPAARNPPEKRIPKQTSSLNRVATVISATREALIEVGYNGLSMLDIAARAGVTHTSIYHYFKSVDHILAEMMQGVLNEVNQHSNDLFDLVTTHAEFTEACIQSWRLSLHYYSKLPEARAFYAAKHNVPMLAEIERADIKNQTEFLTSHFKRVAPQIDDKAVHVVIIAIVSLAVPMYEVILGQPDEQRMAMTSSLEEMIRMHLERIITTALSA